MTLSAGLTLWGVGDQHRRGHRRRPRLGAHLVVDACFDAHFLRQERRVDQAGRCFAFLGVLQKPLHDGGQNHLPSRIRLDVRGFATICSETHLDHLKVSTHQLH